MLMVLTSTIFGATFSVDGEDKVLECLNLVVKASFAKSKYKDVTLTKLTSESSFWGYYEFDAENSKKENFRGFIYASVWNKEKNTFCEINREMPLGLPTRLTALRLSDLDNNTIFSLSTYCRTKGKKFGFGFSK